MKICSIYTILLVEFMLSVNLTSCKARTTTSKSLSDDAASKGQGSSLVAATFAQNMIDAGCQAFLNVKVTDTEGRYIPAFVTDISGSSMMQHFYIFTPKNTYIALVDRSRPSNQQPAINIDGAKVYAYLSDSGVTFSQGKNSWPVTDAKTIDFSSASSAIQKTLTTYLAGCKSANNTNSGSKDLMQFKTDVAKAQTMVNYCDQQKAMDHDVLTAVWDLLKETQAAIDESVNSKGSTSKRDATCSHTPKVQSQLLTQPGSDCRKMLIDQTTEIVSSLSCSDVLSPYCPDLVRNAQTLGVAEQFAKSGVCGQK